MPKFRKKSVVIEAELFAPGDGAKEGDTFEAHGEVFPIHWAIDGPRIYIRTLEGDLCAGWGDWIIKGVMGELYPCKPDIFAATYEPV